MRHVHQPQLHCKTISCTNIKLSLSLLHDVCNAETIRLVNGPNNYTGRVEVFVNGQWGTVCDDGWDINDAHVICRQLGYLSARTRYCCARFGQGTGPMLQLGCQGSEESLHECPQVVPPFGCGHHEDAGVECYNDSGMYVYVLVSHNPARAFIPIASIACAMTVLCSILMHIAKYIYI